jgi:uncharacterized protein
MNKKRLPLIVFAVNILAFISGCAPTTTKDTVRVPVFAGVEVADINVLQEAQALLESAPLSDNPDNRIFDAAVMFANAGDLPRSAEVLGLVVTQQLSDPQYTEFSLFAAELDLSLGKPQSTASRLGQDRFANLSKTFNTQLQKHSLSLQAEANFALGNIEQGLLNSIGLVGLLKKKQDIRAVHNSVWHQLTLLPYSYLQKGQTHRNAVLAGWLQLAQLNRKYQANAQAKELAFENWQLRWRSHPAAKTAPIALKQLKRNAAPSQVALLLPLQEQYEVPSYTLLDGFMGAYYQFLDENISADAPEIRVYDTSVQSLQRAYNNAVEDGAEMIIGPMRQSEVEALLLVSTLPVPTLSLNRVDTSGLTQPENLFQFGLAPEDEMAQIADRAWLQGKRNVLVVAPNNGWGTRSTAFFNEYWRQKGGTVLDQVAYPSSVKDFTPLLKPPLLIDLSEERALQVKRFVNSRIKSKARRRQDLDLVVILGYPVVARQIKPALDFLYASEVPVVATSHIYNGIEQAGLDRDLTGVEFSAMPWTLPGHLANELKPDRRLHTAYRHLYAVGHDAFLLHRNLNDLQSEQAMPLFGATGILSLSEGVIVRQQKWAEFRRGKVIELPP